MKKVKIAIIGNSVALRVRPLNKVKKNYGILIEEYIEKEFPYLNALVNNMAFSRATIIDIQKKTNDYLNQFPDFYILNIGIPDASTREIPYWYANIIHKSNDNILNKVLSSIHSRFFAKYRPFFVKIRGKHTWIRKSTFRKKYTELVKLLLKETNARIILLSINLPDKRIENIIPGTYEKCLVFNKIIKNISTKFNLTYLDFQKLPSQVYYPDGIHYSAKGHKIVANEIYNAIKKYLN